MMSPSVDVCLGDTVGVDHCQVSYAGADESFGGPPSNAAYTENDDPGIGKTSSLIAAKQSLNAMKTIVHCRAILILMRSIRDG